MRPAPLESVGDFLVGPAVGVDHNDVDPLMFAEPAQGTEDVARRVALAFIGELGVVNFTGNG